jgi:hypothetical protein
MFLLEKYGDSRLVFCEVVGFAIPEKGQSAQKKGQAETCPYPQKEAKMKTYIQDTTKVYSIRQKAAESMSSPTRPSRQGAARMKISPTITGTGMRSGHSCGRCSEFKGLLANLPRCDI